MEFNCISTQNLHLSCAQIKHLSQPHENYFHTSARVNSS